MMKELKKGRLVGFLIAIFLTNVALMNDQAIIPIINNIYTVFPENQSMVNYVVTGSLVVYIITSLLAGKLTERMSKKTIIVVAFGIFTLAAVLCVAIENVYYIAVMRTIIAASIGVINVSAIAMVADAFESEKKRSIFIGLFNSSMAVIGAIIAIIAGNLAVGAWQSVFRVFYIGIPVFFLLLFFLPKTSPDEKSNQAAGKQAFDLKTFIPFILSFFILVSSFMVYQYMLSVYIAEHALGDEAFVGICASMITITSGILCALFGLIYERLHKVDYVISFALVGLSYILLYFFPVKSIIIVCSALMGMAFGNGISYAYMEATVIVPPSQTSKSIAIVTAVQGAGMFVSTYLATFCMNILHTNSLTKTFPVYIILMVLGVGYAVMVAVTHMKKVQGETKKQPF